MAPETRIGLVVGLAFIICFAIILANKGERERSMTPWLPVAGDATKVHPAAGPVTLPPINTLPMSEVEGDARVASLSATHQEQTLGLLRSDVTTPPLRVPNQFNTASQLGFQVSDRQDNLLPSGRLSDSPASPRITQAKTGGAMTPAKVQQAVLLPRRVAKAKVLHTVVKGDTLSKTAWTYYGKPSNKIIRAIYEANRKVLSDPNVLPLGAKIILPVVEGLSPKGASSAHVVTPPGTPEGKRKGKTPPRGDTFRWYQIRKQDRYASIAREQLGDASRWHEIFEMNRGKFPDADRIREGVRIKLPTTTMASAGGR